MSLLLRRAGLFLWCTGLLVAIWLMFRLSVPYVAFDSHVDFLQTKQKVYHINYWRISFYIHVFTSIVVLPAGFTQFHPGFFPRGWHRRLGTIYLYTVLFISAPTGFLMGLHANGGLAAKASFVLLSLTWFLTTLMAVITVKKKKFEQHGEWMLFSYALTLSAIFFRLYVLFFDLLHINARPSEVYVTVAWLSWVPNLIVALFMIRSGFIRRLYERSGMKPF
jgi:hypothetical protein